MSNLQNSEQMASNREIGLYMECEEEDLSPAQVEFYANSRKSYENFQKQLDEYNAKKHIDKAIEDGGFTMFENLLEWVYLYWDFLVTKFLVFSDRRLWKIRNLQLFNSNMTTIQAICQW